MNDRIKLAEWQPIETAPKDGSLILGCYRGVPMFVAWVERGGEKWSYTTGHLWWRKEHKRITPEERGWRILIPTRDLNFAIHGNYEPINLDHWMPIPEAPEKVDG